MKRFAGLSLFAAIALLCCSPRANAGTQCPPASGYCYFYGGDFDLLNPNANALANENDPIIGGNPYGAATYQNFVVSGGGITVSALFTNNLSGLNPTSGYWEIRSGVSEGNGGTLIASGTAGGGNFTHVPTGRMGFGWSEYSDTANNLNVSLSDGTYWFAMVPNDPHTNNRSFNSNTFGPNAVGSQISDQRFWNSAFFGANFTNADTQGVFPTFSSGAYAAGVPEPSSLVMLGSGLVAAAGVVRRRMAK
jgi:hypothetical protein